MIKKILTVVGARPQIIKSAAISRAIASRFTRELNEIVVHTGQHYDREMSEVFFADMDIARPAYNLAIGSASHAAQTGAMLPALEKVMLQEQPNAILVYGDTNSTLAAAIAASKLSIPIAHVEAGLRSFNKKMPEEINRILTDHVSTLLFAPTIQAMENLQAEGFRLDNHRPFHADNPVIFQCGDVMLDNALFYREQSKNTSDLLHRHQLNEFILATIHRDANTDHPQRLTDIVGSLAEIAKLSGTRVVIPLHPRTRKMLQKENLVQVRKRLEDSTRFLLLEPVSYLDMIALESHASMIITDSGGVQKEAFFFRKPCIILRPQTEWIELVSNGNAIVADSNPERILQAYSLLSQTLDFTWPEYYGNGNAAEFICEQLISLG